MEESFFPQQHNEGFDRSALRDQYLRRETQRAIQVPVGDEGPALPGVAKRANSLFGFDGSGGFVPFPISVPETTAALTLIPVATFDRLAGETDDLGRFQRCAAYCVVANAAMYIDRDYFIGSTWTPPAGLMLRGPLSQNARIVYTGAADGISIAGAIDMDGIIVDGGIANFAAYDRSQAPNRFTLLGIHGDMLVTPGYLAGIRIGRVQVQNSKTLGFCMANVTDPQIGELSIVNCAAHGSLWTGVRRLRIGRFSAVNIGTTSGITAHFGQAMLITCQGAPEAAWYGINGAMPTSDLQIGQVQIRDTTDTAFYINDDRSKGCTGIQIGSVDIDTAGKDGFKIRSSGLPVTDVQVGSVRVNNVAQVGFGLESCQRVSVGSLQVNLCGQDTIGDRPRGLPERWRVSEVSPELATAGAVGGIVTVLGVLGQGVRWLFGWNDRRADRIAKEETELNERRGEYLSAIEGRLERVERSDAQRAKENWALRAAFEIVAAELRRVDPGNASLTRAEELLKAAFPLPVVPTAEIRAAMDALDTITLDEEAA
ncbi:hypothetical protein [Sphingomonas oryzagri]|uniref:Right handed beta helix domain-containing protein n=1 Tax=Sphingomonas oryzagri TaxID=3042314 RepID=A0ABT6N5U1_9SPHN|nr:hypothetical protein [Sphingomonas oryzagri]MDH7640458.1 hypothetical protein [Sphingomonas oryzagri]